MASIFRKKRIGQKAAKSGNVAVAFVKYRMSFAYSPIQSAKLTAGGKSIYISEVTVKWICQYK